jgi:hypothetical protein
MPRDGCWDGATGHSSFAHAVFTFRKRAGRGTADDARPDLFEKVFIGLFADDGAVEFFDVEDAPPFNQPPKTTITLTQLVELMRKMVSVRNEGVDPEKRYVPGDPEWQVPEGSLPEGLEADDPLRFEESITDEEDPEADADS